MIMIIDSCDGLSHRETQLSIVINGLKYVSSA